MEILFIIISLIALGAADLLWGVNSGDDVNSEEWRRMAAWPAA